MAMVEKDLIQRPKISEIENLQDLSMYVCARYRHLDDWYLKCLDCPGKKTCAAGQRAIHLLENSTAPKNDIPNPKTNLRGYINYVFTQKDPIRILLESSVNIRPQSVYARVWLWKKNYPDLEEKYHMVEKIRFLWSKPWNSMRISDILKKLYTEEGPANDFNGKYAEHVLVNDETKKQEEKVMNNNSVPESGEISLEDFLKNSKPVEKSEPVEKPVESVCAEPRVKTCDIPADGDSDKLDELLKKLRKNVSEYEQKIQDIQKQISAVLTVQQLMKDGC